MYIGWMDSAPYSLPIFYFGWLFLFAMVSYSLIARDLVVKLQPIQVRC